MATTDVKEIKRMVNEVIDPIIGEALESLNRHLLKDISKALIEIHNEVKVGMMDIDFQLMDLRTALLAELFQLFVQKGVSVVGMALSEDQLDFSILMDDGWNDINYMTQDIHNHMKENSNLRVLWLWNNCSKVTASGDGKSLRFIFNPRANDIKG